MSEMVIKEMKKKIKGVRETLPWMVGTGFQEGVGPLFEGRELQVFQYNPLGNGIKRRERGP